MAIATAFFGSPTFAVPPLQALAGDPRFRVLLAVTQPDRPAGRGRRPRPPAVKVAASELGIPVWQPETLREPAAVQKLRETDADLYIVAAYGEILRRDVLSLPNHGCLNIHPSLLPRYRGATPIPAAILHGDTETGVTIIRMVRKLDAGPVIAQRRVPLTGRETGGTLSDALSHVAADMLPGVGADWVNGRIQPVDQDDGAATFTREFTKADARIDWRRGAIEIERLVRALAPWPRAWATLNGARLTIHEVRIPEQETVGVPPGVLTSAGTGVLVGTGTSAIELVRVQPAGRREMDAEAWYRGAHLPTGAAFTPPDIT